MDKFDYMYPDLAESGAELQGMWQLGMVIKMRDHLSEAKKGDTDRERKLITRLGQTRRFVKDMDLLSDDLLDIVKKSVVFLRSTGRKIDLGNKDPRYWITTRDGRPRW